MNPPTDLKSLLGVWSRRSIRWPDGREDTSTRVWWLQANPHYADLRLPANRPSFAGVASFDTCSPAQRQWLATQQGFAGQLAQQDDAWLWQRDLDYQPPTGRRDIGRLWFNDSANRLMTEEGVDEPYVEVWERVDHGSSTGGQALVLALQDERSRSKGLLVAVGDHFLLALREGSNAGVELSHGNRCGSIAEWVVTDSTYPWREGERLFPTPTPRVDWDHRSLEESRNWRIVEPAAGKLEWMY